MIFDDVIQGITAVTPAMNKAALRDFVQENINNSPEFIKLVLQEASKLVEGDLEYEGYTVMSPEERVRYELKSGQGKNKRPRIPLTESHMRLCNYHMRFEGHRINIPLYTPYMHDDMIMMHDKRLTVRKVILEKTFSREQEKEKDGLTANPIRVNILFNRRKTWRVESYVTGEFYNHFIITTRMFYGEIQTKICDTTIVHFMLAKFGFSKTLKRFGIPKDEVSFVGEIGRDTDDYEYFAARKYTDKVEGPGLFLRVKKTLLADDQSLKFIVNLMYVLSFFDIQTMNNVYVEEGSVWKVILGIILFNARAEAQAHSNAETNLRSVDHYIDPLTRKRFQNYGVMIEDIYDLLVYVFINIDAYMVNTQSQDLYNSRLDVANGILVEAFARPIFISIYQLNKKTNITLKDVEKYLQFNAMMFANINNKKVDDSEKYMAPPSIIGDNYLLSGGLNKIRMGGKADQRLHPSMLVGESVCAFVGKKIGRSGLLNPYIPIDANGAIVHPDYARETIDQITPFLPR